MQNQVTLTTAPQESLRALERAVAGKFEWRIQAGGEADRPRFVVEKKVPYELMRGAQIHALYQIIGGFEGSSDGKTLLRYAVSAQSWVPFFYSAVVMMVLGLFTGLLASLVSGLGMTGNPIGFLLVAVMLMTMIGYGWLAYQSYRGHVRELQQFMAEFAQRQERIA
jgi:hypothetical protein